MENGHQKDLGNNFDNEMQEGHTTVAGGAGHALMGRGATKGAQKGAICAPRVRGWG